jgi:hypothetical protein
LYDHIGQLKVATSSVGAENRGYAYDKAWNLNYRTNNGVLGTFQVDVKNELTNAPSPVNTITYDANGNLLTSGNARFSSTQGDWVGRKASYWESYSLARCTCEPEGPAGRLGQNRKEQVHETMG